MAQRSVMKERMEKYRTRTGKQIMDTYCVFFINNQMETARKIDL